MAHLPSNVSFAISDHKNASMAGIESALTHYSDDIHPDTLAMLDEEYQRRGGDAFSISDVYEPPTYDFV